MLSRECTISGILHCLSRILYATPTDSIMAFWNIFIPDENAAAKLEELHHIAIYSDGDATPSNGVRSGNGTLADPYIISGYYVTGDLYIADTDACFVVAENYIRGQLTLNWNGQCVHAHHNFIRDLRVNENIRRDGYATGGLIELNKISYVGQLRHYDGEFRDNVIGPFTADDVWDTVLETVPFGFFVDTRAANIDGFNEALIHHNTFYGSVDLDLHGHHHGTGFFAPHSHYHGDDDAKDMKHDHTERWTSVAFTDNLIVDPEGYGLRYEDENHAGDDRTAQSESEEDLEMDHTHYTDITLARNTIEGGGLWVDIFNADDRNHDTRNPGSLQVVDNVVNFQERQQNDFILFGFQIRSPTSAISIEAAKEVELTVTGNQVSFTPLDSKDPVQELTGEMFRYEDDPAGINLYYVRDANVTVAGNIIENFPYGIRATQMDEKTHWNTEGNTFKNVGQDIWYDDSVANEPGV